MQFNAKELQGIASQVQRQLHAGFLAWHQPHAGKQDDSVVPTGTVATPIASKEIIVGSAALSHIAGAPADATGTVRGATVRGASTAQLQPVTQPAKKRRRAVAGHWIVDVPSKCCVRVRDAALGAAPCVFHVLGWNSSATVVGCTDKGTLHIRVLPANCVPANQQLRLKNKRAPTSAFALKYTDAQFIAGYNEALVGQLPCRASPLREWAGALFIIKDGPLLGWMCNAAMRDALIDRCSWETRPNGATKRRFVFRLRVRDPETETRGTRQDDSVVMQYNLRGEAMPLGGAMLCPASDSELEIMARPARTPFRVLVCATRTLNAAGESWFTLSLGRSA